MQRSNQKSLVRKKLTNLTTFRLNDERVRLSFEAELKWLRTSNIGTNIYNLEVSFLTEVEFSDGTVDTSPENTATIQRDITVLVDLTPKLHIDFDSLVRRAMMCVLHQMVCKYGFDTVSRQAGLYTLVEREIRRVLTRDIFISENTFNLRPLTNGSTIVDYKARVDNCDAFIIVLNPNTAMESKLILPNSMA